MAEDPTVIVVEDAQEMGERAAQYVADVVARNPQAAISVPTGSTPLPMFADLAKRVNAGALDLSRIQLFCLDEYLGVRTDQFLARALSRPGSYP